MKFGVCLVKEFPGPQDAADGGTDNAKKPTVEDLMDGNPILGLDLLQRLEQYYDFTCEGGPLANCSEWGQLKMMVMAHNLSRRELFIEGYIAGQPKPYFLHCERPLHLVREDAKQAWKRRTL